MSVQKNKGKWYPVVYNPTTKKHVWFSGFRKKADAEKEERKIRAEFDQGKVWLSEDDTFEKLFNEWIELVWPEKFTSKNAAETTKKLIENHVLESWKNIPTDKITSQMVARLLHNAKKLKSDDYLSPATKHKLLSGLNSVFQSGKTWGYVNVNPCEGIQLQSPKPRKYETWNIQQLNLYLENIRNTKYYVPIFILATTGMRRGEVLGLQWQDFQSEVIVLQRAMDSYGNITDMKTSSSHRVVSLMQVTIRLLEQEKVRQKGLKKLIGSDTGTKVVPWDFICTDEWLKPILPNALSKFFHGSILQYNKEHDTSLPVIRLHDLRHTFASTALENNINIKIVSEMLGHSRTSTTQNIYQHLITENLQKEAMNGLEKEMFSNNAPNETLGRTLGRAK